MNEGSVQHCCDQMIATISGGETAVVYVPKFREYGIMVLDGGPSYLEISFCPWCGKRFPDSVRIAWFNELEASGLEPTNPDLPPEFLSEEWWLKRHL